MARAKYVVSFKSPPDASKSDELSYLYDAVTTMRGCYHPPDEESDGDPMWGLDPKTVKIAPCRKRKTK